MYDCLNVSMQGWLPFSMKSHTALLIDMKWLSVFFLLFSMLFFISSLLHCWTTALGKQLPSPSVIESNIMCSWHLEIAFMISNAIVEIYCHLGLNWFTSSWTPINGNWQWLQPFLNCSWKLGVPINGNWQWTQSTWYTSFQFLSSQSSLQVLSS